MSRVVLQKLFHPGMSSMVLGRGYDQVGGFVVEAAAAAALRTPQDIRAAYGYADDGSSFVDVVRFSLPACASVEPPSGAERPWPAYPLGFLNSVGESIVPVWVLSTTRYSAGAEVWRIHASGQQQIMAAYGGAARGWSGSKEWRPASRYLGTRGVWSGVEYVADVRDDTVELTSFVEPDGGGWVQHRVATWSRTVPLADCEVYELHFQATLNGIRVRVLEVIGSEVRVQLLGDDPSVARRVNAHMTDFGVFELAGIPGAELADTQLVANQLVPSS